MRRPTFIRITEGIARTEGANPQRRQNAKQIVLRTSPFPVEKRHPPKLVLTTVTNSARQVLKGGQKSDSRCCFTAAHQKQRLADISRNANHTRNVEPFGPAWCDLKLLISWMPMNVLQKCLPRKPCSPTLTCDATTRRAGAIFLETAHIQVQVGAINVSERTQDPRIMRRHLGISALQKLSSSELSTSRETLACGNDRLLR